MIRKHLRSFVFNLSALWLAIQFFQGVSIDGGNQTLVLTAIALTLVNLLVKPLVKLLLLPINLLTLGAFRWLINVVALYLVTLLVQQFKISAFLFPGFSYQGFIVPPTHVGTFWVYVITSLFISIVTSFLIWLTK